MITSFEKFLFKKFVCLKELEKFHVKNLKIGCGYMILSKMNSTVQAGITHADSQHFADSLFVASNQQYNVDFGDPIVIDREIFEKIELYPPDIKVGAQEKFVKLLRNGEFIIATHILMGYYELYENENISSMKLPSFHQIGGKISLSTLVEILGRACVGSIDKVHFLRGKVLYDVQVVCNHNVSASEGVYVDPIRIKLYNVDSALLPDKA